MHKLFFVRSLRFCTITLKCHNLSLVILQDSVRTHGSSLCRTVKHSLLQLLAKFYGNLWATFEVIAKAFGLLFSGDGVLYCWRFVLDFSTMSGTQMCVQVWMWIQTQWEGLSDVHVQRSMFGKLNRYQQNLCNILVCLKTLLCRFRGSAVERWSLTGELSLSCARPAANGWPLMCVNRPL